MEISLKGRSALITGGSEGLGKGMAMRFAQSGADVAILARRPEVLDRAKADLNKVSDRKVIAIPCDLLNQRQLQKRSSTRKIRWERLTFWSITRGPLALNRSRA